MNRLLTALGYSDDQIKPKSSLEELIIHSGRRRLRHRPDYAVLINGRTRWIIEAKAPDEDLDDWVGQSASYCLELNSTEADNPVSLFLLTNGITTRLYRWDQNRPLLEVAFHQFVAGNDRYEQLRTHLTPEAFRRERSVRPRPADTRHVLRKRSVSDLNADFAWAHRLIYKREALSYTAAFMEFVKVIFLKLLSDRQMHALEEAETTSEGTYIPADMVFFSRQWIESRERETPNPLDRIHFHDLLAGLETEIRAGTKKRIFPVGERLLLSPDTIKAIVDRFQHVDLISLDADLNGRMFETFLNSTLRGKALGQYFTPRSVVKLATALAQLKATRSHTDVVMDACCGTGGFLIEALAVMWAQIDGNQSLTAMERESLRDRVATKSLFGVDLAKDPALARIARINMYLHGDGGSRIYQLDALDQGVRAQPEDDPEIKDEKAELRRLIRENPDGLVDVVLTNPPFAKDYSRSLTTEEQILDDYSLAYNSSGGARRPLATVGSMNLFFERYHGLMKEGGRLVTVVDDSILGAPRHKELRRWLRANWLIRAVVSLPGDAFQMSQARVKTSLLVLEKRRADVAQTQPAVFMYYCNAVGVDDSPRQRTLPIDAVNRARAKEEIGRVARLYEAFREGEASTTAWAVAADVINDRLDVKACLTQAGRRVEDWQRAGLTVVRLDELVEPVSPTDTDRSIDPEADDELVTYLRVRYDGFTEAGDEVWTSDVRGLSRVREGDLVFSHINAIHGAVAVVPAEHDGFVITTEYTACRPLNGRDARTIWSLVRSPEARADLVLLATGIGRTRIRWEGARQLLLPEPTAELETRLLEGLSAAEAAETAARRQRADAQLLVEESLSLTSGDATDIIAAFKPPR